jgi:hypothetical protein
MSVSQFPDAPFGDEDSFMDFLMVNAMAHQTIAETMMVQGKIVSSVPIGDMTDDMKDWLMAHADIHQQEFDQLGLTGMPDLATVDLENEQAYYDWMQMHSIVHSSVGAALGI